tara:strand:- start:96 stop:272 length:177 start_codon:yes stop_codon:yes gene_type:complete
MKYLIWVNGDQMLDKPMPYDFCVSWVNNYKLTKDRLDLNSFEEIYIISNKYRLEVNDE